MMRESNVTQDVRFYFLFTGVFLFLAVTSLISYISCMREQCLAREKRLVVRRLYTIEEANHDSRG